MKVVATLGFTPIFHRFHKIPRMTGKCVLCFLVHKTWPAQISVAIEAYSSKKTCFDCSEICQVYFLEGQHMWSIITRELFVQTDCIFFGSRLVNSSSYVSIYAWKLNNHHSDFLSKVEGKWFFKSNLIYSRHLFTYTTTQQKKVGVHTFPPLMEKIS